MIEIIENEIETPIKVTIKKIDRKIAKKIFAIVKTIGIADFLNVDVKNAGKQMDFIKNFIVNSDEISEQVTDLLTDLTNLTYDEAEQLPIDDIIDIFKLSMKKNKFASFLKSGN
jgi:hypothetical protein